MNKIEFKPNVVDKLLNVISSSGEVSYAYACKLLRKKDIKVNDKRVNENILVTPNDTISYYIKEAQNVELYSIIYSDDNILIVNKKKGIEVENGLDKLTNAYAVHRLDRNTEGLVVLAKTLEAKEELEQIFKQNLIEKYYICEVVGFMDKKQARLKAYLVKDADNSKVMIFKNRVKGSKEIETEYQVLKEGTETSILEVRLITGRTHQIRAHLAYLGHAIIGDGKYGKNSDNRKYREKSQKLVCFRLKFKEIKGNLSYLSKKEFKIDVWFMNKEN